MGNTTSANKNPLEHGVFVNELAPIKDIVNKILDEKDMFKNKDYNFLSQDVCKQHYVLLQQELNQHLKVELEDLGTSLYIIPRNEDEKLTKHNLTKGEICQKISNHYIKILYILCLVKYVYNVENNGDLSIAGIVFRNFKILDDILEIDFCQIPHKDYSKEGNNIYKIDMNNLEGMSFFINYFLTPKESNVFMSVMRLILSRKNKTIARKRICSMINGNELNSDLMSEIEKLYEQRYGNKLVCTPADKSGGSAMDGNEDIEKEDEQKDINGGSKGKKPNLFVFVEKDNPILSSKLCMSTNQLIIKTNTKEGKKVLEMYNEMKRRYSNSLENIKKILDKLIQKNGNNEYELKDITKNDLDMIVEQTKTHMKVFFMQSIIDFQNILDYAKTIPNISLLSEK